MSRGLSLTRRMAGGWYVLLNGEVIGWVVKGRARGQRVSRQPWKAYCEVPNEVSGRYVGVHPSRREAVDEVFIEREPV